MSRYVDEHRGRFGVELICRTLGVSVSAYYQRRRGRRPARAVEDERLLARITELHAANYYAYGYRRMWKTLRRVGERVPRCRVQRLMKNNGIQGAKRRGKPWRTTGPDRIATCTQRKGSLGTETGVRSPGYLPGPAAFDDARFDVLLLDTFSSERGGRWWTLGGQTKSGPKRSPPQRASRTRSRGDCSTPLDAPST